MRLQTLTLDDFGSDKTVVEDKEVCWTRDEAASQWAADLVKLWGRARSEEAALLEGEPGVIHDGDVVQVGEGILALGMTRGIDEDSSDVSTVRAILLCQEQRDAALDAVDAVEAVRKVVLTGSPGAGKTFGTMAAVVAELLRRCKPVLRTSKDPARLHLLKVHDDGVAAWSAPWTKPLNEATNLIQDERLNLVVDPLEDGDWSKRIGGLPCRVIHMPSDNENKHYDNWHKNAGSTAAVLYTSPPSSRETIILCRTLWRKESLRPGQTTLEGRDLEDEISRRALLVGPFPRYIVFWDNFKKRVGDVQAKLSSVKFTGSDASIVESAIQQWLPEESGKLHITYVDEASRHGLAHQGGTPHWSWRKGKKWVLQLLVSYGLHSKVPEIFKIIKEMQGGSSAGWFFERSICEKALLHGGTFTIGEFRCSGESDRKLVAQEESQLELQQRELVVAETETHDAGFAALERLTEEQRKLLRLPTSTFPAFDFATGKFTWFNAKSDGPETLKCSPALSVLQRLGVVTSSVERSGTRKLTTWKTAPNKEHVKASLYIVSYNDTTSTISLNGTENERSAFLAHLRIYRLGLGTDVARTAVESSVKMALDSLGLDSNVASGSIASETASDACGGTTADSTAPATSSDGPTHANTSAYQRAFLLLLTPPFG